MMNWHFQWEPVPNEWNLGNDPNGIVKTSEPLEAPESGFGPGPEIRPFGSNGAAPWRLRK